MNKSVSNSKSKYDLWGWILNIVVSAIVIVALLTIFGVIKLPI